MPLYTGSLGFGDTYVRKLLGRIGSLDVEDCTETVKYLSTLGLTDLGPGKQFLSGGSHGGFLTAHRKPNISFIFHACLMQGYHSHWPLPQRLFCRRSPEPRHFTRRALYLRYP